jgi:lipoprotein-anchoring transpeptidase ErfK/SrfK
MPAMPTRTVQSVSIVAIAIATLLTAHTDAQTRGRGKKPAPRTRANAVPKPPPLPCGDLVGFQVLLDSQGFSPGEIDGKTGDNLTHVLSAFQATKKIEVTGQPDCNTWHALGGDGAPPLITTYTITDADVKGPFIKNMPRDLEAQAKLPDLGYQSALEKLAERFHAAPALLQQLNHAVTFAAGQSIQVPATQPFDPDVKPTPDPAAGDITIQVSKEESAVRAIRPDGTLMFFAPVSSGSVHDPLPIGNWKVSGVAWHPDFHYNPDLFWDAKPDQNRATLKPGPNNPVGVVWISVNIEHYGMHGTPAPGNIGHTESHGCVRLTNWDAARLAALVKPGTPVVFQ